MQPSNAIFWNAGTDQVKEGSKFDGDGTCTMISDVKKKTSRRTGEYSSIDFGNWFGVEYDNITINEVPIRNAH